MSIKNIKTKWSLAFWTVNFLGWAGIVFVAYSFTPSMEGYKETKHFLMSLWVTFLIGMVTTGLLRAYIMNVNLDDFSKNEILKILAAVLIASGLYFGLSLASGYLMEHFADEKIKIPEMYKEFGIGLLITNSLMTIIGWTVIYMAVKVTAKLSANRLERSELNATIRQAQLNTLKGQINPHFMFNSLNNIRGLMLEDVEKSREMLTKLSEMLRYSLTKNDVNAIALEEELEMVDNYISLSKIQFEDRLNFVQEIGIETLKIPIPPMIIQLLIENAAKHGISNLKDGGTIKLSTKLTENELEISVRNTGKLQIDSKSTQLGLKNIKQRLRLLYANRATFSLDEVHNEVLAIIKIPVV